VTCLGELPCVTCLGVSGEALRPGWAYDTAPGDVPVERWGADVRLC